MKQRPLAELVQLQSGFAFKSKEYTDKGHFLVRIGNVQDGYLSLDNPKYVTLNGKTSRFALVEGDFLTSLTGNIGRVARVEKSHLPAALNQRVARIKVRDHSALSADYLFYFMSSDLFKVELNEGGHGVAQQNVSPSEINALTIPLAPLPEQRRIAGILDEAFAGIATAKANAEKNLQNARALFESHLNAVFTQRGDGEVEKPLKEFVDGISTGPFGSLLHKSDYESGGVPLVNPINIVGGHIVPDERKAVGESTSKRLAAYSLQENDIVIARRGEIGRCAVVISEQAGWLCGTGSFFIRPSTLTNPYYIAHLLRSQHYRQQLERLSRRATMPSISNSDLASLVVRIPPVERQERLLSLLDDLSNETQRLESIYQRKIAALEELKKSLLHQAFSGQL